MRMNYKIDKGGRIRRYLCHLSVAVMALILLCCIHVLPVRAQENTGVEGFVTRLYNICLDRDPDPAGFNAWVNQLKSGANTGAEAAYGFVFSNEFKSKNPCNTDYIASLYRCFLGREPDSAGMSAWLARIEAGDSRGTIFNGFVGSDEFTKICQSYGINRGNGDWSSSAFVLTGDCQICGGKNKTVSDFVTRLYNVCLDRNPDSNGLNSWVNTIINGQSGAQTAYGFVFSNEFVLKNLCNEDFVEYMYKVFFGRDSDAAGKAGWVNVLNNGGTKGHVFSGFTGSDEFKKLCAQYGISAGTEDYSSVDFKASGPCSVCQGEAQQPEDPSYQQKYDYKMFIVNKYKPLYTTNNFSFVNIYIKTDNPSSEGFSVTVNGEHSVVGMEYSDVSVEGEFVTGLPNKVEGGYLFSLSMKNAGSYTVSIEEIKEGCYEEYAFKGWKTAENHCITDAKLNFTCEDYQTAYDQWIDSLVDTYTKPDMTPEEKFYAIVRGEFSNGRYTYDEVVKKEDGTYRKAPTLADNGTIWQNHRLNSANSPKLLVSIGQRVGYDVKAVSYDISNWFHAYVDTPDGDRLTICPPTTTGDLGTIKPFDFSVYK